MARKICALFLMLTTVVVLGQDTTNYKCRKSLLFGGNAIAYTAGMTGLYHLWYKEHDLGKFHFFNDNHQWNQMDKAGHVYSCYYEGVVGIAMMKWAGYNNRKASIYGGAYGLLIQTGVELFDGFSAGWGASYGDVIANLAGTGLVISQSLLWAEQRIWMKYSYLPSQYAAIRPNTLGSNLPERMLKDYNAQTYWLSVNLKSFLPESGIPPWLNIALGYGADGLVGGSDNTFRNTDGSINTTYIGLSRTRQFYLSPDIDFTRIPTDSKALKVLFTVINCYKFPLPAIEYSTDNQVRFNWFR